MCMTGIGGIRSDYERLVDALEDIARDRAPIANKRYDGNMLSYRSLELCDIPAESEVVNLSDAAGRICAASIIPYPPGIPIACPGERLTAEMIAYIEQLISRGEKVIGVTAGKILVGAGAVLV